MLSERKKLLNTYYHTHQRNLSRRMLKIAFINGWNAVFLLFHIPYSRANILFLVMPMVVLLFIQVVNRRLRVKPIVMQHIVLLFLVFVSCCLYYSSGYKEAWGYFLAIPVLAGLYGNLRILFFYSVAGLITMLTVNLSIDISNRVLLYVILGTFSYLLPKQLDQSIADTFDANNVQ